MIIPTTPITKAIVPAITNNRLFNLSEIEVIQPLYSLKEYRVDLDRAGRPCIDSYIVMSFADFGQGYTQSIGGTLITDIVTCVSAGSRIVQTLSGMVNSNDGGDE